MGDGVRNGTVAGVDSLGDRALRTIGINKSVLFIRVPFVNQFRPYYIPNESSVERMAH